MMRRNWLLTLSGLVLIALTYGCEVGAESERGPHVDSDTSGSDAGTDAAPQADGDASPDDVTHHWSPTGGPAGGIGSITRMHATLLVHGNTPNTAGLAAISTDGGDTFREPTASEVQDVDAIWPEWVVEASDGTLYTLIGSNLYRREADSVEWSVANDSMPDAVHELQTAGEALVALADRDLGQAIMVSEDRGHSWHWRDEEPASSVLDVATWQDRIFARAHRGPIQVSDDLGRTWTPHEEADEAAIFGGWVGLGDSMIALHHDDDTSFLATSTDGLQWESRVISGNQAPLRELIAVGEVLYAVAADGAVGELRRDDAHWSEVTGSTSDFIADIQQLVAIEDGIVAIQEGVARKWTPASGWRTLEYGFAVPGELIMAGEQVWHRGWHLWRWDGGEWSLEPSGRGEFLGAAADGAVVYADQRHCVFGWQQPDWEFVLQWTRDGVSHECSDGQSVGGSLTGVASLDDELYLSKSESRHYYPGGPGAGGVFNIGQREFLGSGSLDVRQLTATSEHLWLNIDGELYSSDGQSLDEETWAIRRDTGADVVEIVLISASGAFLIAMLRERPSGGRIVARAGESWHTLPVLEAEIDSVAAGSDGVWAVADGRAWYIEPPWDDWHVADQGLADVARVATVVANEQGVFAHLENRGVWQRARNPE